MKPFPAKYPNITIDVDGSLLSVEDTLPKARHVETSASEGATWRLSHSL